MGADGHVHSVTSADDSGAGTPRQASIDGNSHRIVHTPDDLAIDGLSLQNAPTGAVGLVLTVLYATGTVTWPA